MQDALTAGTWGGTHWKLTVNTGGSTGTIEGDCSLGTITNFATSGSGVVSFTSQLVLQFETPVTQSLSCSDGALNTAGTELSGNLVVGTYTVRLCRVTGRDIRGLCRVAGRDTARPEP